MLKTTRVYWTTAVKSFTLKAKKHVIPSWKSLKRHQPSLAAALGGRACLKSVRRAEKLQNELPGWRTVEPRSRMNLCSTDPFRDANVHPANVSTISLRTEAPSVIELWRVIGLRRQATVRLMGPSGIYAFAPRRILPDESSRSPRGDEWKYWTATVLTSQ